MIDFIHIGYPKTGTSWLQHRGLRKHPNIKLLNYSDDPKKKRGGEPEKVKKLLFQLCNMNDLDFEPDIFKSTFKEIIKKHKKYDKSAAIGVSAEILSGDIYNGRDSAQICNRLFNVFGPVKILIIIRNQIDMIESTYKQYVHEGGTLGINKFLDKSRLPFGDLINRLQYQKLISYYHKMFGKNNVFVGLYEIFKLNKKEFLTELFNFIGIAPHYIPGDNEEYMNRSHHTLTLNIDRFVNLLFKNRYSISLLGDKLFDKTLEFRSGNKMMIGTIYRRIFIEKYLDPIIICRFFKTKPLLNKIEREHFNACFHDCNKYLSNLLQIDLSELGYSTR